MSLPKAQDFKEKGPENAKKLMMMRQAYAAKQIHESVSRSLSSNIVCNTALLFLVIYFFFFFIFEQLSLVKYLPV